MAQRQKISQMPPKGANLSATDLLEISEVSGTGYITKSITGQEIINAASGGSQNLQQVTDIGATTTNPIQITHSGSTDTLTANHSSGTGIGLLITKGGNNEGLKVNKTSGSGNAATIIGTLEATTLVKTGGLATEFLMADGSTSLGGGGITVGTTAVTSGTDGRVFFQAGGVVQQDAAFFWDNTNKRLGVGATPNTAVRLDVRAQGALSTDIAFRVRNSADTADLISFRGDSSEWIQSVPFRHAASLTGTNNTSQGLFLGYNVASLATTSTNAVIIGRGSGAILQGNGNTIIGDGFSHGTFSNSIGLGRGVVVNGSNQFVSGSQLYPTNTWLVSTGGEVTHGSYLRGLDFKVSGMAGGPSNISAATFPVRFFSPNGTGTGAGSNIQFHVAPSNTGGGAFFRNIFSEMFTIRGEADGLNHYQLATPRVPSASITDGYVQYSNDITAGNAAPHFRTENGAIVKVYQETTAVTAAAFVANTSAIVDDTATFGGYTIGQVVAALKAQGLLA
jgi:hypothetical protein